MNTPFIKDHIYACSYGQLRCLKLANGERRLGNAQGHHARTERG